MAIDAKFGPFPGDPAITRFMRRDTTPDTVLVPIAKVVERLPTNVPYNTVEHLKGAGRAYNNPGVVSVQQFRQNVGSDRSYNRAGAVIRTLATEIRAGDREAAIADQCTARATGLASHIADLRGSDAKFAYYALGQVTNRQRPDGVASLRDLEQLLAGWAVDNARGPLFAGAQAAVHDLRSAFENVQAAVQARGDEAKAGMQARKAEVEPLLDADRANIVQQARLAAGGRWRFYPSEGLLGESKSVDSTELLDHLVTYGEVFARRDDKDPAAQPIRSFAELKTFLNTWAGRREQPAAPTAS